MEKESTNKSSKKSYPFSISLEVSDHEPVDVSSVSEEVKSLMASHRHGINIVLVFIVFIFLFSSECWISLVPLVFEVGLDDQNIGFGMGLKDVGTFYSNGLGTVVRHED